MLGGTVKLTPLLAAPPTVTTTFPVVAPLGTATAMFVALQLVGVAGVPLKATVLVPCVPPKFVPAIVTEAPTSPDVELKLVMLGVGTAGRTSTMLRLKRSPVGAVSLIVTLVPLSAVGLFCICTQ
jgi:hypothetical protein